MDGFFQLLYSEMLAQRGQASFSISCLITTSLCFSVAFKSREDHRKQLELEEARKAGLAPAEVDEDGKEINPHIPQYMSSAPWYLNAERPVSSAYHSSSPFFFFFFLLGFDFLFLLLHLVLLVGSYGHAMIIVGLFAEFETSKEMEVGSKLHKILV